MINIDQRLTTANGADDKSHDSSDLLSMLRAIEQLYAASRIVISSHSEVAILVSLAVEVQTLLTKLRAMRQRWAVHLPFKEASTVDFVEWSNKAKHLASVIRSVDSRQCLSPDLSCPSCHCLIDIYLQAADASCHSEQDDMPDPKLLLNHHAAVLERLATQREQCIDAISQLISCQIADKQGLGIVQQGNLVTVRNSCSDLLTELAEELFQLHEQQVKIFSDKDYERLADRILYEDEYEGQIARREARDIMHNWRNGVPTGKLEESRKAQIEQTKEEIRKTKHGVKLEEYVNLDADFYGQRSEFGKFLFNRRRSITRSELRELILLVYCVYYYQKDVLQEAELPDGVSGMLDDKTSELYPDLPTGFEQKLRDNQVATMRFYRILRRVEPYVNNSGASVSGSTPDLCAHYKDWGWYHVKTAFEHDKLGFLPKNSSKSSFAQFIHSQFPRRKALTVQRAIYRNENVNSPNIVADVIKEFSEVWK